MFCVLPACVALSYERPLFANTSAKNSMVRSKVGDVAHSGLNGFLTGDFKHLMLELDDGCPRVSNKGLRLAIVEYLCTSSRPLLKIIQ